MDILLLEGKRFICPWTHRHIRHGAYAIDHLMPVSVYPINELWNLVPADSHFNSHVKSNRLPSPDRLAQAKPHLALAYLNYETSKPLSKAMHEDVPARFAAMQPGQNKLTDDEFACATTEAVADFLEYVANARNLARF